MGGTGVLRAALVAALLSAVQVTAGLPASPGVAAAGDCAAPTAIFAVDGTTGHLVELASCPDAITEVGEVDTGDWRPASRIFATGDDTVTVVYRITADGRLESFRQPASGAPLEAPVRVGAGIDWSQFRTVIVPRQGYLWVDDYSVHAFRHDGWATGGTTLHEGPPVFSVTGPETGDLVLTGLGEDGRAEAVYAGFHWRVWRTNGNMIARRSGAIPYYAAGSEPGIYDAEHGAVSLLTQAPYTQAPNCPANPLPWTVGTSLPGDWWGRAVVVPQRTASETEWPEIAPAPGTGPWDPPPMCPPGADPYQWQ